MDEKLAREWVEALRSGEYTQGHRYLKVGNTHCCLGVLAEVAGFGFAKAREMSDEDITIYSLVCPGAEEETGILKGEVLEVTGLQTKSGEFKFHWFDKFGDERVTTIELTEVNDNGLSFNQIADIIEWAWQDL